MRYTKVLFAVAVAAAVGCEVQNGQDGPEAHGPYFETGDDDGCAPGSCCASVPTLEPSFRCSDGGPYPPAETGLDDDDDGWDEETGDPEHVCTSNVIADGGFELGTPSRAWDEFASVLDTPICNGDCGDGPVAFGGEWFAWFGGVQQPAEASLTQVFSVTAATAQLRFQFGIGEAAGTGDDRFEVLVDGNTVFLRTDADIEDFPPYTVVPLTLDQWADGQPHELRFESEVFGDGLTNFLVDEVELIGCGAVEPPADSSGGATEETGPSTGESSTSGGDTTTGSATGSTSGGSDSTGSTAD